MYAFVNTHTHTRTSIDLMIYSKSVSEIYGNLILHHMWSKIGVGEEEINHTK